MYKAIIAICLAALLALSCSKEEEIAIVEPGSNSKGTLEALFNNSYWSAEKVRAYKEDNFTRINGTKQINDANSNYSSATLYIDLLYLRTPILYAIGENGKGLIYNAHAKVVFTPKAGSTLRELEYTGQYIKDLSTINISKIDDEKIEAQFGFKGINKLNTKDTLMVEMGKMYISFK